MTWVDVFRVIVCLGLLTVAAMIASSMQGRLYDKKSLWLVAYVTTASLAMFIPTAANIGHDEPLKWYGVPFKALVVIVGIIYIYQTRGGMKGIPHRESGFREDQRQPWFDTILKWAMPNGTVMRRYIAMTFIVGVIAGAVLIRLVDRTDNTAQAGEKAICAVLNYGEDAVADFKAHPQSNPKAVARLSQMNTEMRATGVGCPARSD